jgi:cyclopropane-fatty-acyl-phospholipid synthase
MNSNISTHGQNPNLQHLLELGHPTQIPSDAPIAARTVFKLLQRLSSGSLLVQLPGGDMLRFGQTASDASLPPAQVKLNNWKVCAAALKSGDIGFAESYIAGDWSTPDLAVLLQVLIANRRHIEDVVYGNWMGRALYRLRHLFNRNTKANSRKNIHAHYDLGNAFYKLWLDDTMNYSSAWFAPGADQNALNRATEEDATQTMRQAQHAKVRRALDAVQLRQGHRLLEIGCGWGALAEAACKERGAQVTGVTLSTEQLAFAQERLTGQAADLRLQDYRDISEAPFDAICSIEMVEAVGREYWSGYFAQVAKLLKPGGRACIQSIVIDDALFERYLRSTDFIQQYIFPGGCLPCPSELRRQAQAAGLEVVDEFAFGQDYARTCRWWREKFLSARAQVLALGFDERFVRIWEFYLAYCEAAFAQKNTDVLQITLRKAL